MCIRDSFIGWATPTEGGALGGVGALGLALGKRKLNRKLLIEAMEATAKITSFVIFILIGSSVFSLVFRGVNGDLWVEPVSYTHLDVYKRQVQHFLEHRQLFPGIAPALGRVRLLEKRQQLAHFPQRRHILRAHPQRDPFGRPEQVGQHRNGVTFGMFKQQRLSLIHI